MGRETRVNVSNTGQYRLHIFLALFFSERGAVLEF